MVYRNYAMAREWQNQGHKVTIIAGSHCHSRHTQPFVSGRVTEEVIDGVRYLWVRTHTYSAASAWGRVSSMLSFTAQCMYLPLPLDKHYDIVMCSSPHPFVVYPARKLARRFDSRFIYDIRDLWPLTVKLLGKVSEKHPLICLMQAAEDYACRHADLITAVPQNARAYLISRGMPSERFLVIGNGIATDMLQSESLPVEQEKIMIALRAQAEHIVGYVGTLGTANAMADLIHAIDNTPENVHLAIMGDGPDREKLQVLSSKLGLIHRVHFLRPVSRSQVGAFLQYVDIGYAGTNQSSLYQHGASLTKVNDYFLAARPLVYAVGDPDNSVERSGAGISCSPGSPTAIAAAICHLVDLSPSELAALGQKGREWCLRHQLVSEQTKRMLEVLYTLPRRDASS